MYRMDQASSFENREASLDGVALFRQLRAGLPLIGASTLGFIVLALLYLAIATPKYRAEILLVPAPVNQSGGLGGVEALGGLASLAGVDLQSGTSVPPFDVFRAVLAGGDVARTIATPEIMQGVFPDRWDARAGHWVPQSGFGYFVKGLFVDFGLPDLRDGEPDWRMLRSYLKDNVKTSKGVETPVFTVSFDHRSPEFARKLLTQLWQAADDHVRARDKARAEASIAHLSHRLDTETRLEHRAVLAAALGEQERVLMMAAAESPYAAEMVEDAFVSRKPVSPNVGLTLAGALFFGLLAGCLLVLFGNGRKRSA